MHIIGLTGGIGTGKSTVAGMLAELGVVIIDADRVGHEALKPHSPVWEKLVRDFGQGILGPGGEIDRRRLSEIAFSKPEHQRRLNDVTHPAIYAMVRDRIEDHRRKNVPLVVLEAPLLIDAKWQNLVDEVWVTTAPRSTVLKRLRERSGMAEAAAMARIRAQLSHEERVKHADVVIDTDCTLEELRRHVSCLLDEFKRRHPDPEG